MSGFGWSELGQCTLFFSISHASASWRRSHPEPAVKQSEMMDISEASLLDYIYSSGGKVKNSDLSKTYKPFINHSDLQLRGE